MYSFLDIIVSIVIFLAPQDTNRIQIWPYAADPSDHKKDLSLTYQKGTNGWCIDIDGDTTMWPCLIVTEGKLVDEHGNVLLDIKHNLKISNRTNYLFKPKDFENPLEFSLREGKNERTIEVKDKGKIYRELRVRMWKSDPQGGANGKQPSVSETNRTSAGDASRRSP